MGRPGSPCLPCISNSDPGSAVHQLCLISGSVSPSVKWGNELLPLLETIQ